MSARTVVVLDDNLFLRPRLQSELESEGWTAVFAAGASRFRELFTGAVPDAVLVNLAARGIPWEPLVGEARAAWPGTAVIGFGPHVDEALAARGLAAGCVEVVPNGAVARSASRVVGRHT